MFEQSIGATQADRARFLGSTVVRPRSSDLTWLAMHQPGHGRPWFEWRQRRAGPAALTACSLFRRRVAGACNNRRPHILGAPAHRPIQVYESSVQIGTSQLLAVQNDIVITIGISYLHCVPDIYTPAAANIDESGAAGIALRRRRAP